MAGPCRYAEWLADEPGPPQVSDSARLVEARARVRATLAGVESRWLDAAQSAELLEGWGIPLLGCAAHSAAEVVDCATRVGFPVAVKVTDPGVVHKTELGLVRTGLRTRAQVRQAYRDFRAVVGHAPEVLVQPMVSGTEIALGLVRDPSMGPLVMVASGGVATDVWDDRVFLVPPVSPAEATRAIRFAADLARCWRASGERPPVTSPGSTDLVTALGRLAVDVPELAELDLNPVMVSADGCVVVDAKVRLATPVGPDSSAPRQLRPVH